MDLRKHVSDTLRIEAMAEASNAFRSKALRACAAQVAASPEFSDATSASAALDGRVSARMLSRIVQICEAGASCDPPEAKRVRTVMDLMRVTCIGQVAARRLADAGVCSLDDLEARVLAGGAGELGLTQAQELCVRHSRAIAARIPRGEMQMHAARIAAAASAAGVRAEVVGSYRRDAPDSGDIDVLMVGDIDALLTPLISDGYVVGTIARGAHKYMGLVAGPVGVRRLDVLCTTAAEFPFALLHFTGPAAFNVALRRHALDRGLSLSERGWKGDAEAPAPRSEGDILRHLGVEWRDPSARSADLALTEAPGGC